MSFPARLLNPGEEVAVDVHPHWKFLAGPVAAVVVVVVGGVVALVEGVTDWLLLVVAVFLAVSLLWLAGRYLKWATTYFVVTNERLVLRKGVLGRSGREILLDRLTDISYKQTLLDRLTGCGDILLESPGRDSQEVFPDLPHPVLIQNEIYRLVNERPAGGWAAGAGTGPRTEPAGPMGAPGWAGPSGPPAEMGGEAPPQGPSMAEQLVQLDALRKRGLITKKEFAAKKADLLSRM